MKTTNATSAKGTCARRSRHVSVAFGLSDLKTTKVKIAGTVGLYCVAGKRSDEDVFITIGLV